MMDPGLRPAGMTGWEGTHCVWVFSYLKTL